MQSEAPYQSNEVHIFCKVSLAQIHKFLVGFETDNITLSLPEAMLLSRDGDLPYMDISYENEQGIIVFHLG